LGLEDVVEECTRELQNNLVAIKKMNDLMIGRESKLVELKEENKELKNKLKEGVGDGSVI